MQQVIRFIDEGVAWVYTDRQPGEENYLDRKGPSCVIGLLDPNIG